MYVNQGVGTSALPFRFGVKPEIVFFKFEHNANSSKTGGFRITKSVADSYYLGFHLLDCLETFNVSDLIKKKLGNLGRSGKSPVLFDFESLDELKRLNWECHKWFELSKDHVTSGRYSLKVTLPPGQYPGISFKELASDWSSYSFFKLDIFNPSGEKIPFHIRIDDHQSGWEYADRFDKDFELIPGANSIIIPTSSIKTNLNPRYLNLKKIERLICFVPNNQKPIDLYLDHIRLE
jgi:hypothetical protein